MTLLDSIEIGIFAIMALAIFIILIGAVMNVRPGKKGKYRLSRKGG